MTITVDNDTFRTKFTEFSSLSDDDIQGYYEQIGAFISVEDNTKVLSNALRIQAVYLATAVISKEYGNITTDNTNGGVLSSASEGSVSASFQSIPYKTMAEWDLLASNIQPYGKMLLRILNLAQPDIQDDASFTGEYYGSRGS